jgi:rod shape-determining protein MreC
MAVYRNTNRTRYVLVLLVLLAITFVTVDERSNGGGVLSDVRSRAHDVFAPVQHATHSALRPVGDFFSGALHYGDLKRENALLRNQLAQEQQTVLAAQNAQQQNQLLLQLQHLDFAQNIPRVAAQVTNLSSSNFEQTLEINRGTDNGITTGMPVVSGAGLVGQIVNVSSRTSTVLLLTDPTFSVGVRLDQQNDPGVATGTGQGSPLTVNPLNSTVKLKAGALLETSGLQGETFPPGIPVGRVASSVRSVGTVQQKITLQPVVDVYRLEFVDVLQWSPQQ